MKKIRIFMSSLALVLAIGGAFATQALPTPGQYEFIPAGGGLPDQCISVSENCNTTATNPCQVNSHDVRDDNAQTSCGNLLKRPTI